MSDATARFTLEGRAALVTGAGRGLGRSIAAALAGVGAEVWLLARSGDELEHAAASIRAAGGRAVPVACDVTESGALARAIGDMPMLDVLVNNAGTNIPEPFVDVSEAHLDRLLDLNVRAAFLVASTSLASSRKISSSSGSDPSGIAASKVSSAGAPALASGSAVSAAADSVGTSSVWISGCATSMTALYSGASVASTVCSTEDGATPPLVSGSTRSSASGVSTIARSGKAMPLRAGDTSLALEGMFGEKLRQVDIEPLKTGQKLKCGSTDLEVLHSPGHSPGSIVLFDSSTKSAIVGDTVFCDGGVGRWDLPGGDLVKLRKSIKRLEDLGLGNMYPGHGSYAEGDAQQHLRLSLNYIAEAY